MNKVIAMAVLAIMLVPCGIALAETVEGTVASVDLDGKKVDVTKKNAETGADETVSISVGDTTTYTGDAASLAEIIEGDKVKVEADKDAATGNWVAKSMEVTFAEEEVTT